MGRLTTRPIGPYSAPMDQHSQQPSDERLWQMLDMPGAWLVRTDVGMLRPPRSLREALWQAWTATAEGGNVASILKLPGRS
jgi:hypothetical protein